MSRKRSNHCHPTATAPYTVLDFLTHKMPNSTVTVPDFLAHKVPNSTVTAPRLFARELSPPFPAGVKTSKRKVPYPAVLIASELDNSGGGRSSKERTI